MFAILMNRSQPIFNQFLNMTPVNRHLCPGRVGSAFFLPTQQTVAPSRFYSPVPVKDDPRIDAVYSRLMQRHSDLEVLKKSYRNTLKGILENPHPNPHDGRMSDYEDIGNRIREIEKEMAKIRIDLMVMGQD